MSREIRDLLAAYCHTADDGRFGEFAALFAEDAALEVMGERIEGRAAIREWIEAAMPPERRGRHVTVNTHVQARQPDRAVVVSDFLFHTRTDGGWQVRQVGRYHDEVVRDGETWSFARREIRLGTPPDAGPEG